MTLLEKVMYHGLLAEEQKMNDLFHVHPMNLLLFICHNNVLTRNAQTFSFTWPEAVFQLESYFNYFP